ncbi:MAG: gluconokinase [Acidimicrobiia bacterium]|nr:gluconokinase [Acidimicrobiia bacterium]
MIVVLMGAAGALGWPFIDADDLHPQGNVDKMGRGIPLTDEDRAPWLARVHERIEQVSRRGSAVLACSALRPHYRDAIAAGVADVRWVLLAALEPPADALVVAADRPVPAIVEAIRQAVGAP